MGIIFEFNCKLVILYKDKGNWNFGYEIKIYKLSKDVNCINIDVVKNISIKFFL